MRCLFALLLFSCVEPSPMLEPSPSSCGTAPARPGFALLSFDAHTVVWDATEYARHDAWVLAMIEWSRCVETEQEGADE